MSLQFPQNTTTIGIWKGHKIKAIDISKGIGCVITCAPSSNNLIKKYTPTRGIEITNIVIKKNGNEILWLSYELIIPDKIAREILFEYFAKKIEPQIKATHPNLNRQSMWLSTVASMKRSVPSWNKANWRQIAIDMIKRHDFGL